MHELKHCALCGEKLEDVMVEYLERYKPQVGTIIFGNVPAKRCPGCGERYYSSKVALVIDKVMNGKAKPPMTVKLPLYPMDETLAMAV